MFGDFCHENPAEFAELLFANAADTGEIGFARRIKPGHLSQRHVGENDVGRHGAFIGKLFAQGAQGLEQRLVAGNFAGTIFRRGGWGDGFGKRDFLPRFQRGAAGIGQFDDVKLLGILEQQAEPHQFASDGAPLGTGMLAADVVGGKILMAELADFFGVRAAKHFNNVLDAHAKTAFLANAIDTGEEFLRGERAIPRGTWGEAVVAAGAIIFIYSSRCEQALIFGVLD